VIDACPLDPDAVASIIIAVYDGLVLQYLADPEAIDWRAISPVLTQMMLSGLVSRGKSA